MERGRILVVEDDPTVLRLLLDILDIAGYEATGVGHPDSALDVARRSRPDLALVDVMLPRRSGIQVAEELRAHGFAGLSMIAMSASPIMRELADHTGQFQATVDKPFDLDALAATIERVMAAGPVPRSLPPDRTRM